MLLFFCLILLQPCGGILIFAYTFALIYTGFTVLADRIPVLLFPLHLHRFIGNVHRTRRVKTTFLSGSGVGFRETFPLCEHGVKLLSGHCFGFSRDAVHAENPHFRHLFAVHG